MYNIESLIQRGAASVQLNTEGGVLGVTVNTINPQYPSQGTTDIDASLLRDVKATLSNNAMPSVGTCNVSIVDGAIMIVAPNNCPLVEGGNLIVISGVYLNTMFVWSVSVEGVTDGHLTANISVTLQDGDITGILTAIEPDIAAGKQELAAAISDKGVETSADAALSEMANNVGMITQESYTIDGGEMYAKQLFGSLETPNYWNLYDVLANLLSDGRLVSYGGILLAEYYRGYDSLALSGAGAGGAYVVSDKDSDGNFIMYTEDTTHTWATEFDGKGNRWVAYCFADEYHDFQITNTNTSPRSIFIGRNVGAISLLTNSRVSQIVVCDDNKLGDYISGQYSSQWDKRIVINNLGDISGRLINGMENVESIYIEANSILETGSLFYNNNIRTPNAIIAKIKNSISGFILNGSHNNYNFPIIYIECPQITGTTFLHSGGANSFIKNLHIKSEYVNATIRGFSAVNTIYLEYISNDKSQIIRLARENSGLSTDVVLQEGWCKPINISQIASPSEANMYAHILQRLKQDEPDCGDGVTITLGSINIAKLTSEESVQLLDDLTNIYGYTFA